MCDFLSCHEVEEILFCRVERIPIEHDGSRPREHQLHGGHVHHPTVIPYSSLSLSPTTNPALTFRLLAAGFTTGFSFYYSSNAAASVNVYSGLNGTGTLLATVPLVAQANVGCTGDPSGFYCNWTPIGVTFTGTAQSVAFGGTANQVGFDNITLGAATPGSAVPEPASWAMLILGMGLIGAGVRRAVRRSEIKFDAKIKRITAGLEA